MKLTVKAAVKQIEPDAYCVRLNDGTGYIVWPTRYKPRWRSAIGLGPTVTKAWAEALITLNVTRP